MLLHTNDVGSAAPTNLQPSEDCPTPGLFSCSPQADDDSISACCVQKPGGVLLHVQLWDEDEGVQDSWGIHGLWPDMCDGSFDESTTGDGRAYSASEIEAALPEDYLSEMEKVWVSNDESPSAFWAHEWKTHGVRISTLDPSCFSNYQTGDEIPLFFGTVLALFHQFPTYQLLANENILPTAAGDDTTYSLDQLQQAISSQTGYTPTFLCDEGSTLSSVEYYLSAQGPVQDGNFAQATATRDDGGSSACPQDGIVYPQKVLSGSGARKDRDEGRHRRRRRRSEHNTVFDENHPRHRQFPDDE